MNQFNNPPKLKNKENEEALINIKEGKLHIDRFGGQTVLYIPQAIVDRVGKEAIENLIEKVYTREVLEEFEGLRSDYEMSWSVELPPQKNSLSFTEGKPRIIFDETDHRIEELVGAIKNL